MDPELSIEEQILLYPDLTPEEQRAVDAYVAAHPELRPLWEDAARLRADLERVPAAPPDDEALAWHVARRYLYGETPPEHQREPFRAIEAAVAKDPTLRARADEMTARAAELGGRTDAVAHFERLTGRRLDPPGHASDKPPVPLRSAAVRERAPARMFRLPSGLAYAAATVVVIGAAYGLLFFGSRALQPPTQRLAWFSEGELSTRAYQPVLRGPSTPPPAPTGEDAFLTALGMLADAQQTTLGLFPRFNRDEVRQAESLLTSVAADATVNDLVRADAHYYMGKARLALGNTDGARAALVTALEAGSTRSPEARDILGELAEAAR